MKTTLLILLTSLAMVNCTSQKQETSADEALLLEPAAFEQKIQEQVDAIVLDVRTAEEFQTGKVPNAVNIDFNNPAFKSIINGQNKEKPYFVYCAKGGRSAKAVDMMKELGFKNVYDLKGGISAWKDAGLAITPP